MWLRMKAPGRWGDRWLPEVDVRQDFGLGARASSFRDWLIVMATVHAAAFLPPWWAFPPPSQTCAQVAAGADTDAILTNAAPPRKGQPGHRV